jgi:hypothetical protein
VTDALLAFFKALAHESRLRIIGLLAERERSVQDLAAQLKLKEPTVSHHLAILKDQGLVTVRAEGVTRWHALDVAALESLSRRVLEAARAEGPRAEPADEEGRVLAAFVDRDGRLTTIPAARKKRDVILRWLMTDFEAGRLYPEAEVNRILKARHEDVATLRRELVGHDMLARDKGLYQRLPEARWRRGGGAEPIATTSPPVRAGLDRPEDSFRP